MKEFMTPFNGNFYGTDGDVHNLDEFLGDSGSAESIIIQADEPPLTAQSRLWIKPGIAYSYLENPYTNISEGNAGKVAPHWHSTQSDGENAYADMQIAYRDAGFIGGIKTDHNNASGSTAQSDFVYIRGCEQSTNEGCHVGVFMFTSNSQVWDQRPDYVEKQYPMKEVIDFYNQSVNAICVENHPLVESYAYTKEMILGNDFQAFEIFNARYKSNAETFYDDILTSGKRLWCICSDDCHNKDNAETFQVGWIKIYYEEATAVGIVESIRQGKFIACKQHDMSVTQVTSNSIAVKAPILSDFALIADGQVIDSVPGSLMAQFTEIPLDSVYVRVRCNVSGDEEKYACTQPFYITQEVSSDELYMNVDGRWKKAVFG